LIKGAFQSLPEAQREAITSEFQLSLGSRIYVDAFKKSGWKDPLNALEIRTFWDARGLVFPSPADWAQKNGSQEPQAYKAKIQELENKLKV